MGEGWSRVVHTTASQQMLIESDAPHPTHPSHVHLCAQVYANTPNSVFQALAYLRELLLFLHHNCVVPALTHVFDLLQKAWLHLQDSCKSVL